MLSPAAIPFLPFEMLKEMLHQQMRMGQDGELRLERLDLENETSARSVPPSTADTDDSTRYISGESSANPRRTTTISAQCELPGSITHRLQPFRISRGKRIAAIVGQIRTVT